MSENEEAVLIGFIGFALIVCLVMITWAQMDYNYKLINLEITSCQSDPQHCDSNLYQNYHK